MEQNPYNDPVKSPIVQEVILCNRIGAISVELARRLDIEPVKALELFYDSYCVNAPRGMFRGQCFESAHCCKFGLDWTANGIYIYPTYGISPYGDDI